MIAEELHCTVTEAKARVTPQEFTNKITFWEEHPPMRDHINYCIAQVSQLIFNSNLGRRQKAKPMHKFLIDYKRATLPSQKEVNNKINSILGGLAKNG